MRSASAFTPVRSAGRRRAGTWDFFSMMSVRSAAARCAARQLFPAAAASATAFDAKAISGP